MDDADELWLPVVGFEGFYEVSSQGRVRSMNRVIPNGGRLIRRRGALLRPAINSSGYLQVKLNRDGVQATRTVHSLVAEAFVGPRPSGLNVLHGPGGILDNRPENLRYGTQSENTLDTVRDGTSWWLKIETCPREHRLEAPNLMPSALPWRACLACNRGHSTLKNARRKGVTLDLKTESDRHYRLLHGSNARTNSAARTTSSSATSA